ncbi:MAG TPA: IPT/TIG domain-containing protein [Polyangia bacterium]|nr:IPT/TIG domain-containing protein [Polyangia bacterium]
MFRPISMMVGLAIALGACSSSDLKVTGVEPVAGTVNGSENVIIRGSGFQPGKTSCTVRFGGKEATNVTIVSDEKIQVTTPGNDSGPADVLVTFDDGRTFKLAGAFSYKVPDQNRARDIFLSGGTSGTKVTVPPPTKKQ